MRSFDAAAVLRNGLRYRIRQSPMTQSSRFDCNDFRTMNSSRVALLDYIIPKPTTSADAIKTVTVWIKTYSSELRVGRGRVVACSCM